ncbi:hypothetical protein [Microcystis sp. M_OC_Ca_00000000_S217Cul]|nr:hypothetical protein [Microcystis sp. M_OC_Ca_00000000_S217Cul]
MWGVGCGVWGVGKWGSGEVGKWGVGCRVWGVGCGEGNLFHLWW